MLRPSRNELPTRYSATLTSGAVHKLKRRCRKRGTNTQKKEGTSTCRVGPSSTEDVQVLADQLLRDRVKVNTVFFPPPKGRVMKKKEERYTRFGKRTTKCRD